MCGAEYPHYYQHHMDRELLNEIFNFNLEQKPRNGAFIDALAHYVVRHY